MKLGGSLRRNRVVPYDEILQLKPLVLAKSMRIPTYIVFDSDADKADSNGSRAKHEKDNRALLALLGRPGVDPMPATTVHGDGFTMWQSDIGTIIGSEVGVHDWVLYRAEADKLYGYTGGLRKNSLHIGASLAFAWEAGKRSDSLERLCSNILDEANSIPF